MNWRRWQKAINVPLVLALAAILGAALGFDGVANYGGVSDADSSDIADATVVKASISPLSSEPTELIERRTRNSKTYYLGNGKYAWDGSIGSIHYKDDPDDPGELFKEIDSDIQSSSKPNWDWEVVKGHWHLLISNNTTVALGKDGNWIGFRYEGVAYLDWETKNYEILRTVQPVTPVVDGNKITWPNIFPGTNLEYIYGNDGFKENLVVSQTTRDWLSDHPPSDYGLSNNTTYLGGYLECDWKNAYAAEDEDGNSINWDEDNEFVGEQIFFRHPLPKDYLVSALPLGYATHSDFVDEIETPDSQCPIRKRFYKAAGKYWLLFGSKVTELNSMPEGTIVFDPTVDEQVGASLDDCYGTHSTSYWDAASDRFNAGAYDATYYGYFSGARFQTVNIPQGATIDVAYLTLKCHTQWDGTDCRTKLDGEDIDDAPAFSDYADYTGRTHTSAAVDWDISTVWTVGSEYTSPSIVSVVQEVVDRDGWAANNDLVIFWEDDESPQTANNLRRAHSYDSGTGSDAPKLHIEFTPTWESYSDLGHTQQCDNFTDYATENTIYMYGEGYAASTTYHIIFWDYADTTWHKRQAEDEDSSSSGNLSAQRSLTPGTDTDGDWHCTVYVSGSDPSTYDPDDTDIVADDTSYTGGYAFHVEGSAIPEFPTVIAAIVVVGSCFGIYWWMRKRRLKRVKA